MPALPPVVATLLADTKEYSAKMTEAQAKMTEMGTASEVTGAKMAGFASKASTAVLGLGAAIGGYAVDQAYKYQEALDKIKNQAGLSDAQIKALGNSMLTTSAQTGVSTTDLANAALTVEQAGIRGAAAQNLLNAASKAAVITNSSVANTTMAVVAAEKLHITSGQDVATTMGILVAGSKNFVGGLAAETSMLQGRVGVALSQYGLGLKQTIALGQVFASVGLPTRSIVGFSTGLAKLQAPLDTIHVTAKKTYTTLSTYALGLQNVGLSAAKLQGLLRTGNISGLLQSIKDQAGSSVPRLQQLMNLVFGTAGGATASVLVKNLNQLNQAQKQLSGSGAGSLNSGFKNAISQLGPQFHKLMASVDVLMVRAGDKLLPTFGHMVDFANATINYFNAHPIVGKVSADIIGALIAGSLATKLATVGLKIGEAIGFTLPAAELLGSTFGLAVLAALGLSQLGKQSGADYAKANAEWNKNKAGGAYDVAALTANTILGGLGHLVNGLDPLHALPGNNSLFRGNIGAPKLPIIGPGGPNYGKTKGAGVPGWGADVPTKTLTVKNTVKAK